MKAEPKIVTIGGGTGSFNILQGLKEVTSNITAIISMVDDGGSTGVLRDELGVLPPGDVRQALVALSQSTELTRKLFNYRFEEGSFKGHSFGNVFISSLEKITGSFGEAVKATSKVLNIKGKVVPVTLDDIRLVLKFPDGQEVEGEHLVDDMPFPNGQKPEVFVKPESRINPDADKAIREADAIIVVPGTLHASLLPNFVVGGMKDALEATNAKVIYLCNLVTNNGQTDTYKVHDFAAEIEEYTGPILDYVLYNTEQPSRVLLDKYAKVGEYGVEVNQKALDEAHYTAIGTDLVSEPEDADSKGRMYIRHDVAAVNKLVLDILNGDI